MIRSTGEGASLSLVCSVVPEGQPCGPPPSLNTHPKLFNPNRHDLKSHVARQKLSIAFIDNPQTDALELTGEVEFPNLVVGAQVGGAAVWSCCGSSESFQFQIKLMPIKCQNSTWQAVDFGCVLTDTLCRRSVTLTNPGKAHVNYSWSWLRQDPASSAAPTGSSLLDKPEPSSMTIGGKGGLVSSLATSSRFGGASACGGSVGAASCKAAPPQLFDVLPIRGSLGPGESEVAEVSFYGYPGVKAAAVAVCHVTDGPDYQVRCDKG